MNKLFNFKSNISLYALLVVALIILFVIGYSLLSGHKISRINVVDVLDIQLGDEEQQSKTKKKIVPSNGSDLTESKFTPETNSSYQKEPKIPETRYEKQVNVSGNWNDGKGNIYIFKQTGNNVVFQEYNSATNMVTATAQGTMQDHKIYFSYQTILGTFGNGELNILNDNQMQGFVNDSVTGAVINLNIFR